MPAAFEVVWKRPPPAGPRGAKIPSRGQGWCQPRCKAPARSSPMAKGFGCTWTEQTARESWGSPAPNWDLVLWGPQEWASQGCPGSSPLAQGGLSWPFRAPKILVIPVPPQIPSPGALLGALGTQNPAQRDRSPARICGHQPQTPCAHTPLHAASPLTTGEKAICVRWCSETSIQLTTAGAGGFLPPPLLFKRGGNKLAKHQAH